MNYPLRVITQI